MKLADLERHLRGQGCAFYQEGGAHSIWFNPANRKIASVPRHREINEFLAKNILRKLEL